MKTPRKHVPGKKMFFLSNIPQTHLDSSKKRERLRAVKNVETSTFRILERQHLYQTNINSSGPETYLRTWGTL